MRQYAIRQVVTYVITRLTVDPEMFPNTQTQVLCGRNGRAN